MKNKSMKEIVTSIADLHMRDYHGTSKPDCLNDITPKVKTEIKSFVDHPAHYNTGKYETIDVIEDWDLDFNCGNAVKYISRHMHKGKPVRDIEKAIWYLERRLKTLKEMEN